MSDYTVSLDSTVSLEILNNVWNAPYDKIVQLMENYEPLSDNKYEHPILHEIAHQAGKDPLQSHLSKEQKERFERQNNLFKFLWTHPKMKLLIHNNKYRDKYYYTAIQRLATNYKCYSPEMKTFVKENICPNIELVTCNSSFYSNNYIFENQEHFGKLIN